MKLALALLLGLAIAGSAARAAEIDLGAALPHVQSVDQNGKPVDLVAEGGKGLTLVYFYPKADTPGCTKQACSIRDGWTKLKEKGIRVFGVSGDQVADQKAFEEKYHLPFPLLADPQNKVMDAFGVPHKGQYAQREAFLFKDGKLVWRDTHAATERQADDVLKAVDSLSK